MPNYPALELEPSENKVASILVKEQSAFEEEEAPLQQ